MKLALLSIVLGVMAFVLAPLALVSGECDRSQCHWLGEALAVWEWMAVALLALAVVLMAAGVHRWWHRP